MARRQKDRTPIRAIVDHWRAVAAEDGRAIGTEWERAAAHCWRCGEARPLERAHIVPHAIGGPDEPSNFVLLCRLCHLEAPDVDDPAILWLWISSSCSTPTETVRERRVREEHERLFGRAPFSRLDRDPDPDRFRAVMRPLLARIGRHDGEVSPATEAWLFAQAEEILLADRGPVATNPNE